MIMEVVNTIASPVLSIISKATSTVAVSGDTVVISKDIASTIIVLVLLFIVWRFFIRR